MNQNLTKGGDVRHWTQVSGSPFLRDIDLKMLEGDVTHERWKQGNVTLIRYDRDYVIQKIVKAISPLFELPEDEFSELISEARERAGKV